MEGGHAPWAETHGRRREGIIIPKGAEGKCKTQNFGGDCIARFWEFGYGDDVGNIL